MKKYTEKIHAKRLIKMLQRKEPCRLCPSDKYYRYDDDTMWENHPCDVCLQFVGIKNGKGCPCFNLGEKTAIELTVKTLKKKGYL